MGQYDVRPHHYVAAPFLLGFMVLTVLALSPSGSTPEERARADDQLARTIVTGEYHRDREVWPLRALDAMVGCTNLHPYDGLALQRCYEGRRGSWR